MLGRKVSDKKFQVNSLDGLRGLAALIVVASHTSNAGMYFFPFLRFEGMGKSGVYLFFLLSSFLLTIPLLEKGKSIFDFRNMSHYWQRRFFRIYPLYIIYLLAALLSSYIFSKFFSLEDSGIPFYINLSEFFRHLVLLEGKGVTWSIVVEFKFYFLLPFIVFAICLANKFGLFYQVLFLLTLIALSAYFFPAAESEVNDTSLLPYLQIFIIGNLCALIHVRISKEKERFQFFLKLLSVIGILGIVLLTPKVFSSLFYEVHNTYFQKQFMLFTVLWSFILLCAANTTGVLNKIFSSTILRFFGAISFSLYLLHITFIKLFRRIDFTDSYEAWLVLLFATGLSVVSFKLIEAPASKFKFIKNSK